MIRLVMKNVLLRNQILLCKQVLYYNLFGKSLNSKQKLCRLGNGCKYYYYNVFDVDFGVK